MGRLGRRIGFLALSALALLAVAPASAQVPITTGVANGVIVDADGVLRKQSFDDPGGACGESATELPVPARSQAGDREQVSQSVAQSIRSGGKGPDRQEQPTHRRHAVPGRADSIALCVLLSRDARHRAGRPRRGVRQRPFGPRARGLDSGRPVLELEDLIVALRAFPPGRGKSPASCAPIASDAHDWPRCSSFCGAGGAAPLPDETQMIVDGLRRTSLGKCRTSAGGIWRAIADSAAGDDRKLIIGA